MKVYHADLEHRGHLGPRVLDRHPHILRLVVGEWFKVEGLGLRVEGLELRVEGLEFRAQGQGFRVKGLGFQV